jgi:hypothetical protein
MITHTVVGTGPPPCLRLPSPIPLPLLAGGGDLTTNTTRTIANSATATAPTAALLLDLLQYAHHGAGQAGVPDAVCGQRKTLQMHVRGQANRWLLG